MTISTIADIVRTHGAARPDAPALDLDGRTVTFGELDRRSSQVAQALRAAGVGAGDRVAFVDKNGLEWFETTFGLAKLGAVNVAVNWRLAPAETAAIVEDARAEVVVVGPDFAGHVEQVEADLGRVRTIVAIGGHDRWQDYEAWVSGQAAEDPGVRSAGGDVAFQLYTSGTTGLPKGVMLTNDNFFREVGRLAQQWRFTPDSVNLAMMPMFHIGGAGWAMIGLHQGCFTVVLRDIDLARVLEVIPRHRVTNAFVVPAIIQFLLATPGVESTDFSSLRALAYGASPITEKVLVQGLETFGCEFIQLYGATETSGAITQLDGVDHDPVDKPGLLRSCGKPYPWVEMRIVGPDGAEVPVGEVGELWTRSHQNTIGYWNNPAATTEALTPDGWFRTGDAGYRDADGYLYLHDRVKDMIVTGGENVYPAEVENVLAKHPGVADVAVIGVPDERWGEAVKAIVVPAGEGAVTADDLLAFARPQLAGYKLPKSVDFAGSLPRNPSGKLLKRQLREPYWQDVERRVG